ncbi:hypothetical protein D0Y65_034388 [Glycine soja]|uniref:DUF8040 domain-containing protein n=1 Tax=Glycine soja TaxID=3848 RepID=A0A445HQ04_GLYSO|nr:hypothetical protein D0Y65_034388 [Glycine soja]
MENSKHLATPMSTGCYLDKDESGQPVDEKQYRGYSDSDFFGSKTDKKSTSGTWSLMYAMVCIRPNIAHVVSLLACGASMEAGSLSFNEVLQWVTKKALFKLCRILQEKGQLVKTKNVPIDEAVTMFLHILAHNLKYRVVHFSYCRSMETISRQFKNVLRAIMKVSKEYLKFHEYNLEGSVENKWRWFKNSIGALDGIHISITVSAKDRPRYRNRKGDISTNVLGVCGPDLRFIYVLPGWEGSAGDS